MTYKELQKVRMKFDDKALIEIRKVENELVKNVAKQIENDMQTALFSPLLIKKYDKIKAGYDIDIIRHREPKYYIKPSDIIPWAGRAIKRECVCSGQDLLREGHVKPCYKAPKEKKKVDNRIKCGFCIKLYLRTELDGFNGVLKCIKCFAQYENMKRGGYKSWLYKDKNYSETEFI